MIVTSRERATRDKISMMLGMCMMETMIMRIPLTNMHCERIALGAYSILNALQFIFLVRGEWGVVRVLDCIAECVIYC